MKRYRLNSKSETIHGCSDCSFRQGKDTSKMKRSCAEAEAFEKCAKRDPVDDPEEHVEAMGSTLQSKMNHVVTLITNKWGKIPRLSPDKFYSKLLLSRGYGVDVIKPAVYVR